MYLYKHFFLQERELKKIVVLNYCCCSLKNQNLTIWLFDNLLLQVRQGEIGPFESIKLEIVFTPTIPGEAKLSFHIKFSDATCKPVRHILFS